MKITCRECEHEAEPVEVNNKGLLCSKCRHPFGYLDSTLYFNKKKEDRLKKDRAKSNASVKKDYRL